MLSWYAVIVCMLFNGCVNEPSPSQSKAGSNDKGWQRFTLGPMPLDPSNDGKLRYLVSVPRRYIDKDWLPRPLRTDKQGRVIANAVRFGVKYPSIEPSADAWAKGSIRLTIGNMDEEGISSSVDGTWLNYYSGYSIDMPDEYGLLSRRRADDLQFPENRLYFRITSRLHVRIKCKRNFREFDRWCLMTARRPGEPVLDTGFYAAELPRWRERLGHLRTLFRVEGRSRVAL